MNVQEIKQAIESTLKKFENQPLATAATALFESLGYISQKRLKLTPNTSEQFLANFAQGKTFNDKLAIPEEWKSIDFLFQLTDDEIRAAGSQKVLFDSKGSFDGAVIESYLFIALELKNSHYTRTALAGITRELNKLFAMPALILFRHGDALTLAVINRRLHKRDQTRDVLEKVTLIKDIAFADPIRAHLEILNDFALTNLDTDFGVSNFVALHTAWQKRLGSYALSNDFYREIADWYFWAHHQVDDGTIRLPQHCDTEEEKSLFLIRLLTRLIFCWFLVEKRLLPAELFRDHTLKKLLKDLSPVASTYYHAVLQNLFFGTLNMPSDQRAFREKKKDGQRYDKNFGITNLWRYEVEFRASADWTALSARVPFLNGGLFDCLDDKTGQKKDNFILDGFSDNPKLACHLPNDLFFGPERTVDLSKDYGDEDSRTARSKKAKVRGLIEILSRYKFTIEENTPLEEEIALDPELLGKVFENLLASYNEDTRTTARKALGAFYTPREIVAYMVDEALKSYLGSQVPRCKGALEDLFSNKATLRDIRPDTRDALISAIGRVKILDPACGSGAFPMGALHRLVDLLKKLDPNNESWKRDRLAEARRYRALLEEAGAFKEEIAACDARIVDIEKSFDTRFHALDFARKLYLIENSIYGIDIQPVAVQIAKLRFFIALVVDQKVDPREKNLGVRPLPNLETRLVAADTLIPIEKAESDLFSGEIDQLRSDLTRIRHEHFNARDPGNKHKWREADAVKRQEIAQFLEREHALRHDAASQLAAWDPYDQNTFAPFFDSEWMFGLPVGKVRIEGKSPATLLGNLSLINEAGGQTELTPNDTKEIDSGFDIVIGNPPYVRQEQITHLKPVFEKLYQSFDGRADLFVYFYEASVRLLKNGGVLTFISSNKWLRAKYGRPLRAFLAEECLPRILIDFGELPVFSAATFPMIFLGVRGAPSTCTFVQVPSLDEPYPNVQQVVARYCISVKTEQLHADSWNFACGSESQILDRIARAPNRLPVSQIMAGIKTGFNVAFWLDATTRQTLLKNEKTIGSFIKPMLVGDDIRRFRTKPVTRWIIYTPIGTDIRNLGPLKGHLAQWKKQLEGRALNQAWYELQQAQQRYCEQFERPKIIYPDIAMESRFTLDSEGGYLDMTAFAIASADKALLGILNSQVVWFFLKRTAAVLGDADNRGRLRLKRQYIERIPIADVQSDQKAPMTALVDFLLLLNRHFAEYPETQTTRDPLMLAYFEQILNGLVYELYFPEEVHGAGLRLFELVDKAALPSLSTISASKRLDRLRPIFETLYDGTHPLKIALQKLQTLDTVRIIEGMA